MFLSHKMNSAGAMIAGVRDERSDRKGAEPRPRVSSPRRANGVGNHDVCPKHDLKSFSYSITGKWTEVLVGRLL